MKRDLLFQPLALRSIALRNRIVMSAMTRERSPGGVPGPAVAAYYRRRAEGEAGLIITEGVGIDEPAAVDSPNIPVMHGSAALAGWRGVVQAVHAAGGVIFPQLWHQGVLRVPGSGAHPEIEALRPSGIWGPRGKMTALDPAQIEAMARPGRAMTEAEIEGVIRAYARSARHAVDVGFDGIAIHGAHGYLIDSFLWAETNRRTDAYGGDHAGRA